MVQQRTRGHTGEVHSRSRARVIDAARKAVSCLDLADLLCGAGQMNRAGRDRWSARCPIPHHTDKTPSFVVYTDPARGWYCFGCGAGGDVISLAQAAWGYDRADEAAGYLLLQFGYEVPSRPPSWYRKDRRQREARAAFTRVRVGATQRRIYELLRRDQDQLGNTDPTEAEKEYMWEGARGIALLLVRDREDREAVAKGAANAPPGAV